VRLIPWSLRSGSEHLFLQFFHASPVFGFSFLLSCPSSPVPAVLTWQSCSGGPVLVVLCWRCCPGHWLLSKFSGGNFHTIKNLSVINTGSKQLNIYIKNFGAVSTKFFLRLSVTGRNAIMSIIIPPGAIFYREPVE
jgi:hypothetical protein